MISRYSSRRQPLDASLLRKRLRGASGYDRIAGYFRSSLFEIAGEELEAVSGPIRVVCNSDLDPLDVRTAQAAQQALRTSWCNGAPEDLPASAQPRISRLYALLTNKHIEVKVLPDEAFGLIHGKAGVIRYPDGRSVSFLGSVNESANAWSLNYELVWEDDGADAVAWVQEEFDSLWNSPGAVDLACCPFIENDLKRLERRRVVTVEDWKQSPEVSSIAVESPVYRREQGLWPHQKHFIRMAMERHRNDAARLLLADQVGLGKTVQLAMSALLMALEDDGPVLILAPKPLLIQWQVEMMDLLRMPSARWDGRRWIDENGIEYPVRGVEGLADCPRKVGLVSQGLINRGRAEAREAILSRTYLCVVVDEAHRARRRNMPRIESDADEVNSRAEPNNLMGFLRALSGKTRSMLLATATPVQLHPVEAWDLLEVLAEGHPSVLGNPRIRSGPWWSPADCLGVSMGDKPLPDDPRDAWNYARDPLPASFEDETCAKIRDRLSLKADEWTARPEDYGRLPSALRQNRIEFEWLPNYGRTLNPLVRCIVRRTRKYLEETINPVTKEPFLPAVKVRLFGEDAVDALTLSPYLLDAYHEAESFCRLLAQRLRSAGFLKTLLLRRIGSSIEAGKLTIAHLLGREEVFEEDESDDEGDMNGQEDESASGNEELRNLTSKERESLLRCLDLLNSCQEDDPKLAAVIEYLVGGKEATGPWISRGCILFSQYYDTVKWIGDRLAGYPKLVGMPIGLYAGTGRSGLWVDGVFRKCEREEIKRLVTRGELKLILGTDAASEGLNLQRLGSLVHIDLPWNPTRLEQRKGRIQRIGQRYPDVWIANLRYRNSVEDRVHDLLSRRLAAIHELFGQIPDTLEDAWVDIALGDETEAMKRIDRATALPRNPFDEKYGMVRDEDWDSQPRVIDPMEVMARMKKGWKE